jgi:hypothetical protein
MQSYDDFAGYQVTPDDEQDPNTRAQGVMTATLTAVLTIKHGDDVSRDALTALFLSSAWPTSRAQNQ